MSFDIRACISRGGFSLQASLRLQAGRFHVLLGPSGSGKTTLLRLIAGLEPGASIRAPDGSDWGVLPARLRPVGLMFQQHALFPHMSVRDNIAFGLHGRPDAGRVNMLLDAIGLASRADCRPAELSGGECQRVALARALAPSPKLLLLDEPFSSLDDATSRDMQDLLRRLQREEALTVLMVTHDRSEAYRLADHVWRIEAGRIVDGGEPDMMLLGSRISGRFQIEAEVCAIDSDGLMASLELLVGERRFSVLVDADWVEMRGIRPGARVVLVAKANSFLVLPLQPDGNI